MEDSRRDPAEEPEHNPLEEMLSAFLGPDAAAEAVRQMGSQGIDPSSLLGAVGPGGQSPISFNQLRYLFESSPGPVNWKMVEEIASQRAYQAGDPTLNTTQAEQVRRALTAADLWLDTVTDFVTTEVHREAWTRVDWVRHTLPFWKNICEPVAANVARALADALTAETESTEDSALPPEIRHLAGSLAQAVPRMSSLAFSSQIGQALGAVAEESLSISDTGFPLSEPGTTSLVLTNIEQFADGLEIPANEVLQFLAVREAAHARLFASVPWLKTSLLQSVQRYSAEIAINVGAIEDAARSFSLEDLESMNEIVIEGVFSPEPTEDQRRALQHLEVLLALIEGWIEVVTAQAVMPYLPQADRLREMLRRRRVSGSAGEQILAQMVGLHLRPRQARNAAQIFQAVQAADGSEARDKLWSHPDLVPTADELATPELFLHSREARAAGPDDVDLAWVKLLQEQEDAELNSPDIPADNSEADGTDEDDPQGPSTR